MSADTSRSPISTVLAVVCAVVLGGTALTAGTVHAEEAGTDPTETSAEADPTGTSGGWNQLGLAGLGLFLLAAGGLSLRRSRRE